MTPLLRGDRLWVKICGVTRLDDALLAAELGADAIGLNLWPGSRRFIPAERARAIVERLPATVAAVGVFVNQPADEVRRLAQELGLAAVQLHGDEPPEAARGLGRPVLKAVQLEDPSSATGLAAYDVAGFLLDAPGAGFGGHGRTCDWALAAALARRHPVVLAGGLGPDNVAGAIRAVRPRGVDVASGVERAPGVKDEDKLARFIRSAREVEP